MMPLSPIKLWNGVEIPFIAFGPGGMGYTPNTFTKALSRTLFARAWRKFISIPIQMRDYIKSIETGIRTGFRLIDYSAAYGDGRAIAKAIQKSGIPRSEIFLTGRISNTAQRQGVTGVQQEIEGRILKGYNTDYVDLLMFHWPVTDHYEKTWEVICKCYEKGLARSIGVANCHPHHLERLMSVGIKPMLNQFEVHPLFTQKPLIKYCKDLNIQVQAYTPIARFDDRLMRLPALKKIAAGHNKTSVQVVLRWHLQNGIIPAIRSLNPLRQAENFNIFDFELSPEEMMIIDNFNIDSRLRYHPDNCDFTIL